MAKLHEQKHAAALGLSKTGSTRNQAHFHNPNRFVPNRTLNPISSNMRAAPSVNPSSPTPMTTPLTTPFKKLTTAEIRLRREK
ncbi:hypothetical protein PIB30_115172, partial [Stylosanthes scabra]|nr:hypothetical protein [Stylosanthes scabra]